MLLSELLLALGWEGVIVRRGFVIETQAYST